MSALKKNNPRWQQLIRGHRTHNLMGYYSVCLALIICTSCGGLNQTDNASSDLNEPLSRHGNPPYYSVKGIRYFTLRNSKNYQETGFASWYGKAFHGQRTANGERFDRFQFTAAHKTLPLPSIVEVTNITNKRKVVVRVNDRGPFHGDRLIDLSYAAASQLGIVDQGIAKVNIRALAIPKSDSKSLAYIQVAAFRELAMANQFKNKFTASIPTIPVTILAANDWHRVQIGPLKNLAEINQATAMIKKQGIDNWFFVSSK